MLDREGYRPNVGIILLNHHNKVFWAKRIRENSWQFPQGGIDRGENPEQAMYRELYEEVGLRPEHVKILARTRNWLRYTVPDRFIRKNAKGIYKGQKQIWFLLRLTAKETNINLRTMHRPEFDAWRWSPFWVQLDCVIEFKHQVYSCALQEFFNYLKSHAGKSSGHFGQIPTEYSRLLRSAPGNRRSRKSRGAAYPKRPGRSSEIRVSQAGGEGSGVRAERSSAVAGSRKSRKLPKASGNQALNRDQHARDRSGAGNSARRTHSRMQYSASNGSAARPANDSSAQSRSRSPRRTRSRSSSIIVSDFHQKPGTYQNDKRPA